MKKCLVILVLCLLVASARAAAAEPRADGPLVTCLAADALNQPIWPTTTFPAGGKQMVCVFHLGADESFTKLTSKWIAVDVGDAAPANTVIATGDLDLKGQKSGKLRYAQPGPLPVGKYRLDVLADAKPWKSVEFEVVADPKPLKIDNPADLLPLTAGTIWTYAFVQEAGPGGKVSVPGEEPDADGTLQATITLTVGEAGEAGHEIIVKRNGNTVVQEWWKLDRNGLSATQRKTDADVVRLDPPQPLLPLTRDAHYAWTYAARDGSFKQAGQLWASLPIKGPSGEKPGYLTVMEQPTPLGKTTVERQFIPGVGMVRETVTSSLGPRLLSRQTMTLVAFIPIRK